MGKLKSITRIPFHILRGLRLMLPARYDALVRRVTSDSHERGMRDGIEAFLKRTNRAQRRELVKRYGQKPVKG